MTHRTGNNPTRMVNTEFVSRIHQIFENTSPFHKCFKQKKWSFLTGLVLYLRLLVSQRRRGGVGTLDTHLGKRKITFNSALGKDMLVASVIFSCYEPGKMLEHVKFPGDEFCHTHFSSLTFSALVVGTSSPKVVWSEYLQLT